MAGWDFKRYGIDKTSSIAANYETEWENLLTVADYNPDSIGKANVLETLTAIAQNRNYCYLERIGNEGRNTYSYATTAARDYNFYELTANYTTNMVGTYRREDYYSSPYFSFHIYQQPAFLMQMLAAYQSGQLSQFDFLGIAVVPYLSNAKLAIISAGLGGMQHPHYVESYYLLSTKLS